VVGSAFTHGYKWANDYIKVPQNAYAMPADGLGAAVAMANCAVALYEAQAQRRGSHTSRERRYPERIEPIITRGQQCIADRVRHDGNRETLGRQSTHLSQPYANR
jgi:hypothetical protein